MEAKRPWYSFFIDHNPCLKAVRSQNMDMVKLSCNNEKDVCSRNWIGNNAIHVAGKVCNPKIFKWLMDKNLECSDHKTLFTRRTPHEIVRTLGIFKYIFLGWCDSTYGN